MYDSSDPRSTLSSAPAATAAPLPDHFAPGDLGRFDEDPPQDHDDVTRTWYLRGQNLAVAYTEASAGAELTRDGQIDEYALLLPEQGTTATVTAGGETREVPGYSLVFVPPGDSRVTVTGDGPVVRLLTTQSPDLVQRCSNRDAYGAPRTEIPAFVPWPEPADGLRIRIYSLDVAPEPGRFGRIWRCTTVMVNVLEPMVGPRDVTKLSPHHHDDFEQYSVGLTGSFTHHLRWPWTPDLTAWREDEHIDVGTPSALVIPPPAIHTSHGTDDDLNELVDVFSPPRRDFSEKPGWILNAADYPMPTSS